MMRKINQRNLSLYIYLFLLLLENLKFKKNKKFKQHLVQYLMKQNQLIILIVLIFYQLKNLCILNNSQN